MTTKSLREIRERYIVDEKGKRVGVLLDPEVYKELLAALAELESRRAEDAKLHGRRTQNDRRRVVTRAHRSTAARASKHRISERQQAIQVLQNAGMLTELDPELKRQAAEWRALPEERKREVIETLKSVRLDPPLSQIIHDERR
jgi:hypothetical protein